MTNASKTQVSFKQIYGKSSLEKTPSFKKVKSNNKVCTTSNSYGGWVYDITTGEIYADLPDGVYSGESSEVWVEIN